MLREKGGKNGKEKRKKRGRNKRGKKGEELYVKKKRNNYRVMMYISIT